MKNLIIQMYDKIKSLRYIEKLTNISKSTISRWKQYVNSVLRCTNNECGIVIDRDINGCKNIYNIFLCALGNKPRPEAFCRPKIHPKKETKETVKVGITVVCY